MKTLAVQICAFWAGRSSRSSPGIICASAWGQPVTARGCAGYPGRVGVGLSGHAVGVGRLAWSVQRGHGVGVERFTPPAAEG